MNDADSRVMGELLLKSGFEKTEDPSTADVVIFNSCSVRKHAEDRLFSNLGLTMKKNPSARFILAGCTAQRFGEKLLKRFKKLSAVLGPGEIFEIEKIVRDVLGGRKVIATGRTEYRFVERRADISENVVIGRGCDNFCSYCIVPFLRGREEYRHSSDILREISCLVEAGAKEVILLGQNVNSYRDPEKCLDFCGLLDEISKIKGLLRIRFLTSHPKDVPDELVVLMKKNEKIAKHIHLPVQAGSNKILKQMNRKYTREKYIEIADKFRRQIPDIAITTDIIVGFPTETEEDFLQTEDLVKKVKFDGIYVFKYSPRDGTSASKLKDTVSEEEKQRRHKRILDLARKISFARRKTFVGKTCDVLFEKDGIGHNSQNFLVFKKGAKKGSFLKLEIKDVKNETLLA